MINTNAFQNIDRTSNQTKSVIRRAEKYNTDKTGFTEEYYKRIEEETGVTVKSSHPYDKNGKPQDKKLWNVCIEMESLFVKQMLNTMRKTVHKGELFHGGQPEEIFEDMLYDKYSMNMSKNADLGIAKQMYDQMSSI